jgi:hypothetical protein
LKSTVVLDRLAFLLVDVLVDHLIGDRPGGDRKVAACPEVPTPELALEVRKLLEELRELVPLSHCTIWLMFWCAR